jgi:hypothetical protein
MQASRIRNAKVTTAFENATVTASNNMAYAVYSQVLGANTLAVKAGVARTKAAAQPNLNVEV